MEEVKEEVKEEEKNVPKLQELVERLEKANLEQKQLQAKQEELAALNLIGGRSDAGLQPVQPKEETAREYAQRVSSGRV